MTRLLALFSALLVVSMFALTIETADAARLGGGRSFGSKPSMSKPFTNPTPSGSTMRQQTTSQAAQPGAAAAGSRGLFGGMGGMLGGLLAGGLIGSMLFGGGMGGGSGFLDILLLAGLLYLGFKFFARRRAASAAGAGAHGAAYEATPQAGQSGQSGPGGFDWSSLGGSGQGGQGGQSAGNGQAPQMNADAGTFGLRVPEGFDQEEFLQGAKAAYTRLNVAWDKRDLDDIANFATPAMMDELRKQMAEDPKPSQTEIMLVNASLVSVENVDAEQMASVYFNVLLREDPNQSSPTEVREVWHFVRPGAGGGSWRLDGIQQVA